MALVVGLAIVAHSFFSFVKIKPLEGVFPIMSHHDEDEAERQAETEDSSEYSRTLELEAEA